MISTVMSVYNEKIEWVREAVYSIINQTYKNWELIIIIDNPNLDRCVDDFLKMVNKSDDRIRLLYNSKNIGLAESLNIGILKAKGEYIARMDADDVAIPTRFERELNFIKEQNVDMVSTNAIFIDENSKEIKKGSKLEKNPEKKLLFTNMIIHPSVLMKKEAVDKLGGYRNFRKSQDYDLWLRMLSYGMQIRCMDEYLMKYRIRVSSLSTSCRLEQYYYNLYQKKLYRERKHKGVDSFSEKNLNDFINQKQITEEKNIKCIECMKLLDEAKERLIKKDILFISFWIKALKKFPSITINSSLNMLHKLFI